MISLPNSTKSFTIGMDASNIGIGPILSQDCIPIVFFNNKLDDKMQKASTYVREMFAIKEAIARWRQYILYARFIIHTDHKWLRELMAQTIQTTAQQRFLVKLLGYDYCIEYQPKKANQAADALSHSHEETDIQNQEASLSNLISAPITILWDKLEIEFVNDT